MRVGVVSVGLVLAVALAITGEPQQPQQAPASSPSPRPSPNAGASPTTPRPSPRSSPESHAADAALGRLESSDPAQRAHAIQDVAAAPLSAKEGKAALDRLGRMVGDPDPAVRISLADAFSHLGRGSPDAVAALSTLVRDPESAVRLAAVRALAGLGPAAAEALPALVERLSDADAAVRPEAARALARTGGARFDPAISALTEALRSAKDSRLREEAAHALADADHSPAAMTALLDALDDRDARVREEAVHALGFMPASHLDHVLPALQKALTDSDESVRLAAVRAAARMGEGGIPVLTEGLGDVALLVRWWAAIELGNLGAAARSAEPALRRALSDEKPGVREAAAGALKKMGAAPSPSAPPP